MMLCSRLSADVPATDRTRVSWGGSRRTRFMPSGQEARCGSSGSGRRADPKAYRPTSIRIGETFVAPTLPPVAAAEAARWVSHVVRVAFPDNSREGDIAPPEIALRRGEGLCELGLVVVQFVVEFVVEFVVTI